MYRVHNPKKTERPFPVKDPFWWVGQSHVLIFSEKQLCFQPEGYVSEKEESSKKYLWKMFNIWSVSPILSLVTIPGMEVPRI